MKDKNILKLAVGLSVLLVPTLYRKPSPRYWKGLFLLNGVINHGIDTFLTRKGYVSYPVRFQPRLTKAQLVYDYLICPYMSVWLCQATYKSGWRKLLGTAALIAAPQFLLETWALKKTKLVEYHKGWTMMHTLCFIASVKLIARGIMGASKRIPYFRNLLLKERTPY